MEFHIGQDIVCVEGHKYWFVKEGRMYCVMGLRRSPCGCGIQIDVGIKCVHQFTICKKCHAENVTHGNNVWFSATRFRPLDEIADISELTEVLAQPAFQ